MNNSWITSMLGAMTSGFTELGTKILSFIKEGFTNLFFDVTTVENVTTKTISDFGIFTFVMLGVALTIGLTRWITSLVRAKI